MYFNAKKFRAFVGRTEEEIRKTPLEGNNLPYFLKKFDGGGIVENTCAVGRDYGARFRGIRGLFLVR